MDTSKMSRSENVFDMTNRARIMPFQAVEGMGLVPVGKGHVGRGGGVAPRAAQRAPSNPNADPEAYYKKLEQYEMSGRRKMIDRDHDNAWWHGRDRKSEILSGDPRFPAMEVPEHMIDPILAELPRTPPERLRMIGPALLKAMRQRHMKMAAMKRFEK